MRKKSHNSGEKKNIVILGGGFGGVYTARYLEKELRYLKDKYEIILVNRENYFTFHPMLAEVVGGSLGILDSVSSLRSLLKRTQIYVREISDIDLAQKNVTLSPNFNHTDLILPYDHLIIALGNVTDFRYSKTGLFEHALRFKNLADAVILRNRIIDVIETAALERDPSIRGHLLTFVVGGGGFSGVEVTAEINDFTKKLIRHYPQIKKEEVRVILIHSQDRLVNKELSPSLGKYAEKILRKRGVEIYLKHKLVSATPFEAILDDGTKIFSSTIVSTSPSTPNPLVEALPFEKSKERIVTDAYLQVLGTTNVWALGDAAAVPTQTPEGVSPATAQFAVRQAKQLAYNLHMQLIGGKKKSFVFKGLGEMAALGHRCAVAELFGIIKMSGFFAWLLWRFVYWMKLPGITRKIKVGFSWFLETLIPEQSVQLRAQVHTGIIHLHFVKGETIFRKGDIGDFLYVITRGEVEVFVIQKGQEERLAVLKKGDYFGELALLSQKKRMASVRCLTDCDVIAIRRNDFDILLTHFGDLRETFQKTERERLIKNREALDKRIQENLEDLDYLGNLFQASDLPKKAQGE